MSDLPLTEPRPEASREEPDPLTRIPRAAHARLLLHDLEADPPFGDVLHEVLPDEDGPLGVFESLGLGVAVVTEPTVPPPEIKISAAILALSEPYRERYPEPHRVEVVIGLTVAAWNLALVPGAERARLKHLLLKQLSASRHRQDRNVLSDLLDALIARKQRDYPEVRDFILTHTLSRSGDEDDLDRGYRAHAARGSGRCS
ncbi:MAG: hypothetical protein MZW92_58460 [Comamonadaceae bacterium]|nr:hypothetical protein [Comamonadaceae bacterium]